ncbi:related to host-specific AK-toxin Akt2 [Rhynchosporium agropyri]|uniref:Related to host-specific AK-toxin Akt2 n=3 Tax=Rhynchosporium TaxID=38037 RepID=A0A1E1M1N8_RHYSE|nr:related to host-specific AK-toxin Akt2 [Rhynchosporium commune]CZT04929.1 related to host-specific AK-toxin Akt2 [Rhynchosporium agropyri]CZT43036.1 related to host-specific AK-toxin Akt2 [Rhynchosporium secalis]
MPSSNFQIKEHVIECQHIREYARATSTSQEDVLHLSVKQYTPLDNLQPQKGDVTIIGAHANGFPKELYEPLWEDLHARSKSNGFRIRSIWIADVAQQGQSGVLNEGVLGNDPAWGDHPRDLLHMVNHFRTQMPLPIIGIGHSFGANTLCNLSFIHPRLFSTLILLDPVIEVESVGLTGPGPAQASTFRRDLWPSRAEAEAAFRKQKFYQSWDPRVLDRWCKFGIRETPTALYPDEKGKVTLVTTKHQECFTFARPSWEAMSEDGKEILRRDLVPDLQIDSLENFPFYRPEAPSTLLRLGELRPSTLYIFGGQSPMSQPEARARKIGVTGTGVGGSGGAKEGRVEEIVLEGIGHLVAMEASDKCADSSAAWIGKELKRFEEESKKYEEWSKQGIIAKTTMSEEWQKRIGGPLKRPKSKM